jgi:hypothetical protein
MTNQKPPGWLQPTERQITNMQDDKNTTSHTGPGQEPEIERCSLPLLVPFHRGRYRIDNPDPTWSRNSISALPECSKCGDTLTFCFAPRITPNDSTIGDHAGSYQTPVAIRCNCFLAEPGAYPGMVYHRRLARQPLVIVAV